MVLSGGEPLLYSDEILDKILYDIKNIKNKDGNPKIKFIRIHTRALTHNPFRFTKKLISIFKRYKVNAITFDVVHYDEITKEFINSVESIREGMGKYSPILSAHIPLLKDINDNYTILWKLFTKLYENNIRPYYLLHAMPNTPYVNKQRVPIKKGLKIIKKLKRNKTNGFVETLLLFLVFINNI